MPLGEDPREREEEAVRRLLHAWVGKQGDGLTRVDEETLTAYVMGTASPAQTAAVQAALIKSAEFRQQMLDLMRISTGSFTTEERQVFMQATPPPLEEVRKVTRLANQMGPKVGPSPRTTVLEPRQRRKWIEVALGGWAVTATVAACAIFVVMSRITPLPPGSGLPKMQIPSETSGPAGQQGSSLTPGQGKAQAPLTIGVVQTITLRGPSRGSAPGGSPVIAVSPSTRIIQFQVDPPDVPDDSRVHVTLTDPAGRLLIDEMHPIGDFFNGKTLALQSRRAFLAGRYRLTIVGQRGVAAVAIQYPFLIRTRN